jgi:hypothetical protein
MERQMLSVVGSESVSYHLVQSIGEKYQEGIVKIFKVFKAVKVWIFIFRVATQYVPSKRW